VQEMPLKARKEQDLQNPTTSALDFNTKTGRGVKTDASILNEQVATRGPSVVSPGGTDKGKHVLKTHKSTRAAGMITWEEPPEGGHQMTTVLNRNLYKSPIKCRGETSNVVVVQENSKRRRINKKRSSQKLEKLVILGKKRTNE